MLLNDLIIFAKYPEPGRVKTRLARHIGIEEATRLYRRMVEIVIEKTRPFNGEYRRRLCVDPAERKKDFREWFPSIELTPQSSGDLGARMQHAIQNSIDGGADRVLVIGSDCPDVHRDLILEAFQKLESADIVIGPAKDGGYYLIGMKIPPSPLFQRGVRGDLFTGILWSTEKVFDETMRRIKKAGLTVSLLNILADIDEIP